MPWDLVSRVTQGDPQLWCTAVLALAGQVRGDPTAWVEVFGVRGQVQPPPAAFPSQEPMADRGCMSPGAAVEAVSALPVVSCSGASKGQ